jgi:thiol-disulfide isomerase/thioredoxin
MNNKYILGAVVAIIIIAGAIFFMQNNNQKVSDSQEKSMATEETMTADTKKSTTEDTTMDKDQSKGEDQTSVMAKPGAYKDYSESAIKSEQEAGQKVVLFFHAPWCPFCKAANTAFLNNISQIPAGVTVLKTDYDSNTELKKKYGVTYQHTFVQIDNNGNLVTKWNGGDIDSLKQNLK